MRRPLLWFFGLIFVAFPAVAQLPPTVIIDDTLTSSLLGERRPIRVALPKDYDRNDGRYHVVYALDGSASVEYTIGIAETLYQSGFPRLLVVGIPSTHRSRDLSPTRSNDTPSGGGAGPFLEFIEGELVPWVTERYRTTGYSVLVGHSLGGLFAVYALANAPELFNAYIAISPSVFLNNDFVFSDLRRFFTDGRTRATLFVAMGNEPGEEGDGILRLRDLLQQSSPRHLSWTFRAYGKESHSTVPEFATMDGLRYVFRDYQVPDPVRALGLRAIVAHYATLRDIYHVEVLVPQRVLVDVGFERLSRADTTSALEVFTYYAEVYPDMVLPLDALAEIHRARGASCQALVYVRRILELSPGSLDARRKRDALESVCRG